MEAPRAAASDSRFGPGRAQRVAAGVEPGVSWHIRPDGSDGNCTGTTNAADPGTGAIPRPCAFRTPQQGVDSAGQGDTVFLHAGTYATAGTPVQGNTNIIGLDLRTEFDSEAHRLTIKAAGDGDVVFDGGTILDTGVTIWGTCFVTLEGIQFRRFTANTSLSFAYGAAAVNVGSPGPSFPALSLILRSLTVSDATLDHASGPFAEIAIWCRDCSHNAILSSRITSVEPVAIAVGSDNPDAVNQFGEISDNIIVHSRDFQAWTGLLAASTNLWVVDGNYFEENTEPDTTTDYLVVSNSSLWAIVNNVFFRPPRAAIQILDDASDGNNAEQHLILNNTIECIGSVGIGVRSQRCSACQIRNNIIENCSSAVGLALDNTGTQLGFNDLFSNFRDYDAVTELGFGFSLAGNDISGDPLFTRVFPRPDPYYRLQMTSPAIDAGDDDNCGVVPSDGACDMGAYQFLTDQPPAQPTLTIENLTGRSVTLRGSPFNDPDAGDTHQASQWQVALLTGGLPGTVVHDSGATTEDLTSHRVGGLESETAYTARVRYQDSDDNWSAWSDYVDFTTLAATAIPPKVIAVSPAAGATEVAVLTAPQLTFNVPVDPASVTASTVRLLRRSAPQIQVSAILAFDLTGTVVTIAPTTPASGVSQGLPLTRLDPNSKYKIVVVGGESGVQSLDGSVPGKDFSSSFTTETALSSSAPASGATGESVCVRPQLVFKWPVSAASVTTSVFKLRDVTTGKNVALASLVLGGDGVTVTMSPAGPLKGNHQHRVTVTPGPSGLRFTDGRQLGKAIKVAFRTGAATSCPCCP